MPWQQINASKHPELQNFELEITVGTVTDLREEKPRFDSQQKANDQICSEAQLVC